MNYKDLAILILVNINAILLSNLQESNQNVDKLNKLLKKKEARKREVDPVDFYEMAANETSKRIINLVNQHQIKSIMFDDNILAEIKKAASLIELKGDTLLFVLSDTKKQLESNKKLSEEEKDVCISILKKMYEYLKKNES